MHSAEPRGDLAAHPPARLGNVRKGHHECGRRGLRAEEPRRLVLVVRNVALEPNLTPCAWRMALLHLGIHSPFPVQASPREHWRAGVCEWKPVHCAVHRANPLWSRYGHGLHVQGILAARATQDLPCGGRSAAPALKMLVMRSLLSHVHVHLGTRPILTRSPRTVQPLYYLYISHLTRRCAMCVAGSHRQHLQDRPDLDSATGVLQPRHQSPHLQVRGRKQRA